MWWPIVFLCAVVAVHTSPSQYSVPVPSIDVYSPKGLRISIPDEQEIKTVDFLVGFSKAIDATDPGTVTNQKNKDNGYWIYWNPSISIQPADLINYKITVNRGGLNWTRGGTHFVDKVLSLSDNTVVATADCDENDQQQIALFPVLDDTDEEKSLATNGAKQNNLKSSYSMFKTTDSRPITRSSTTTTSGTFYIKPTGDVEGTGYKTASSFDSTRHDGDQWQHSKSDLSTAELEELKRLHGDDFFKLPAFSHLQFGDLHSSGGGSSSSYRKSSYSSSSSSQSLPTITTGSTYNQIGQAHLGQSEIGQSHIGETQIGQVGHSQIGQGSATYPLLRPSGGYRSFSKYEQHQTSAPAPVVREFSEQSLVRDSNIGSYGTPVVPESSGYKTVQTKFNRQETVKSTGSSIPAYPGGDIRRTDTYDYPTPGRGASPQPLSNLPTSGSAVRKTETYEFSSAPKTPALQSQSLTGTAYAGEIFRSTIRPVAPSSCSASDFLGYKVPSQVDIVAVERNVQELQCLAVLAESTLKSEMRVLRQENTDLTVRIRDLEQQFRRFRDECKCY